MFNKNLSISQKLLKNSNSLTLESLQNLHQLFIKNDHINKDNASILIESFRKISEILLFGDQNDQVIMDYFLENLMIKYFLNYLNYEKDNAFGVSKQILQTLNILFENISSETSIYYLLSNNLTDTIITHKFNLNDEEIIAYYISFLKTLSFRTNVNTLPFFFNNAERQFPLLFESLNLFDHPENMVQIAVRTIVLNICRIECDILKRFIYERVSFPYFMHLVSHVGNLFLSIDEIITSPDKKKSSQLEYLITDIADNLLYINDVFNLGLESLNKVVFHVILTFLYVPLVISSLIDEDPTNSVNSNNVPRLSRRTVLFILIQTFSLVNYKPFIHFLIEILFWDHHDKSADQIKTSLAPLDKPAQNDSQPADEAEGEEVMKKPFSFIETLRYSDEFFDAIHSAEYGTRLTVYCHLTENHVRATFPKTFPQKIQDIFLNESVAASFEKKFIQRCQKPSAKDLSVKRQALTKCRARILAILTDNQAIKTSDLDVFLMFVLLIVIRSNKVIPNDLLEKISLFNVNSTSEESKDEILNKIIDIFLMQNNSNNSIRTGTYFLGMILITCLSYEEQIEDDTPTHKVVLNDMNFAKLTDFLEKVTAQLRSYFTEDSSFLIEFETELTKLHKSKMTLGNVLKISEIILSDDLPSMRGPLMSYLCNNHIGYLARLNSKEEFLCNSISLYLMTYIYLEKKCLPFIKTSGAGSEDPRNILSLDDGIEWDFAHLTALNGIGPFMNEPAYLKDDVVDTTKITLHSCTVYEATKNLGRIYIFIDKGLLNMCEPNQKIGMANITYSAPVQRLRLDYDVNDNRSIIMTIFYTSKEALDYQNSLVLSVNQPKTRTIHPELVRKISFDDHIRCHTAKRKFDSELEAVTQAKMDKILNLLDIQRDKSKRVIPRSNPVKKVSDIYSNLKTNAHIFSNSLPRESIGRISNSVSSDIDGFKSLPREFSKIKPGDLSISLNNELMNVFLDSGGEESPSFYATHDPLSNLSTIAPDEEEEDIYSQFNNNFNINASLSAIKPFQDVDSQKGSKEKK